MKFRQNWQGRNLTKNDGAFAATVPGCIQRDYAAAKGFGDVQYADNCRAFEALENDEWEYSAILQYERAVGERVVFVSRGTVMPYRFATIALKSVLFSPWNPLRRSTRDRDTTAPHPTDPRSP